MAHVVILGAGFAGLGVARALCRAARNAEIGVALVDRKNHTLFTPLLPEVASGSVQPGHAGVPVRSALRGRRTRPFRYREPGMMASLGDRKALADLAGGAMVAGLPAWLMWRAYYLSQLPGAYRKLRVAADWALTVSFPENLTSIERA